MKQVPNVTMITLLFAQLTVLQAAEPSPPEGFRAIFDGKDLTGWHGLNPHSVAKLACEKKEASLEQQRADFPKHWSVENGELVNDGHGPYATSDEAFGDIEFLLEYKTVPKADSGIYLRGTPQVQIWDWNQVFDPKNPNRKPHLGSGGLFNNTPGAPGRDPLVLGDKPFGEWNKFRIRQIGDRTWVWLNDKLVVDGSVMENYWDRSKPLPAKGPIMLQTHGGEIRWRNLFVRDIGRDQPTVRIEKDVPYLEPDRAEKADLYRSRDDGKTWGEPAVIGPDSNETNILHLGDGRWLACARAGTGVEGKDFMELFISDDDGRTWAEKRSLTGFQRVNGHLLKLKDGRVLFCYGDRVSDPGMKGLEAMISANSGETWSKPVRLIDWNGLDGGYPSSVQRADGQIVTAYYCSALPDQPADSTKGYHMAVIVWDAETSFPGS